MPKNKQVEKWLKKKRTSKQYWQVKVFLDVLRLKYKEINKGTPAYKIVVPLFGLIFRFDGINDPVDKGWKTFQLDTKKLEKTPDYFREEAMFYLIEKGYFAYIREAEVGKYGRLFKKFIIDGGWGEKIINYRLEKYGNLPENTYMRLRMEEFLTLPMNRILSFCPGIFDYLI